RLTGATPTVGVLASCLAFAQSQMQMKLPRPVDPKSGSMPLCQAVNFLPSGEKTSAVTPSASPFKAFTSLPLAKSWMRTIPISGAGSLAIGLAAKREDGPKQVAIILPSGDKAAAFKNPRRGPNAKLFGSLC